MVMGFCICCSSNLILLNFIGFLFYIIIRIINIYVMPIYNTKIPQNLTKILPIYYNNGKYIDNIQNKKIINHMQQSKTKLNKTYHPYKNTCIPLNQYSTQTYSNKNSIRTTSTYHNHTFNSSRNSGDRFTDRKEYNQNVLSHSNNYIKQQLLDDIDNQQYQADNQTLSLQQTQLEKITQLVTNLVIKNKLNSKNAFEVPLIDVSQLGIIKKNDENSWNKISNVLENSSKVYGFRVDFVVESINKMTNNIVRSQKMEKIQLTGVQQNKKGKQLAKQDNQINIINSNQYPSLVQVQQEQYYGNTQKPQKINQSFSQFRNDTNYQNVRRMFDQNGITGLLLARLAITNRLNLVVDNSIQYQPIKGGNTENNFVKEEIMSQKKQQIMRKFNIFQEIGMFKYYCFDREQSKDKKEQIMEECYNLCFDDMPEIFRNQDFRENEQYYIETFRDQNQFIEAPQQIKQLMDGKILQKIQINKNSCSNDLMNLFLEPFDQKNQRITNKKQKKQKNEAQPIKKPRKKRKVKNSDHHINFQADLQQNDKSTILSIAAKSDTSRARKTKQKNILKTLVPSFQIQKQMICLPLGQSNKQQIKLQDIQQNSKQFKQFLSGYKDKAEYSQNQFSDFLFSQSGLTERSLFLPMPNIKATKGWLWQQISPLRQIFLSQLHQKYQKQKGPVNEAIIFLSVLHLGNEKNLQISQTHGYEIRIKNYNPIFIQHNEFSHCN